MEKKTLVAYATKGGVTGESARIIADVLRKHGLGVDLVNLRKNPKSNPSRYRNIVAGSGVRMQGVYREFLDFLKNDFKGKKLALFFSSGEAGKTGSYRDAIRKYVKGTLKKYPHLKPVAYEAFGGRIKILGFTVSDTYDKKRVRDWAEKLAKKLK